MSDHAADHIPELARGEAPPVVLGTAALTTLAFGGRTIAQIRQIIDRRGGIARAYDSAILHQLAFQKTEAMALQADTLAQCQVFRVAGPAGHEKTLRLLAVMAPGDLMVNAPLDFIAAHLDVQLDLLYVVPGLALPPIIPDHDVAFFAVSEADTALRERLCGLYRNWPRPALNNPAHLPLFVRDTFARALAGHDTIHAPPTRRLRRSNISHTDLPALIRPLGSHAGRELAMVEQAADLDSYLQTSGADEFFLSDFVDYRSPDGLFRKYRVAFIDRAPYLCHMAVSENWMIHYLNAGMTESETKRADEARAMAMFDTGFARRHAAAFDALNDLCGLDYYSIDCAEMADGRLLVFEADTGAIIHMMDPPDLFPYKRPQMLRIFRTFGAMLRKKSVVPVLAAP